MGAETPDPKGVLGAAVEQDAFGAFASPARTGSLLEAGEPCRIMIEATYSIWDSSTATFVPGTGGHEPSSR